MEIARGIVSNCQHTINVSGGGGNTWTTTTYIALFRVNGRAVEYRDSAPSSISDGDQVIAAGPVYRGALDALACRNLTTGEMLDAGRWSYVIGAVFVLGFGSIICVASALHAGVLMTVIVVAVTAAIFGYLAQRASLTRRAIEAVGG